MKTPAPSGLHPNQGAAMTQGSPHARFLPAPPPFGRWGFQSPGDGPNQGSSGGICRGETDIFSIGEGNSVTVSLPPHDLTVLSLVIAENNQNKFIGKVSGGSNFEECSRRREIADYAPNPADMTELDPAGGKPAFPYGAPAFAH
jgi:hypothetical protein